MMAGKYDYMDAVIEDVKEYIRENPESAIDRDALYDALWIEDSVTGNASGSYTFNTWKAEEYLCHNMDLLEEACEEFGDDLGEAVKRGAEFCDVTVRCYLLSAAIDQALLEIYEVRA